MLNKIGYLFIRDRQFNIRFAVIIILIFSSVSLAKKQRMQFTQLDKIRAEKQLVVQTPEFKKQIAYLEALAVQEKKIEKKEVKKEPVLKGILMANNINYAIIDDTYYQEGDDYGEYSIFKISVDYVIIQNKNTKQQKILYLL